MDIRSLPKVELHLHLDLSLSFAVVRTIDPSLTLESFRRDFVAPSKCNSLVDFLARTPASIALMQTERNLRLVTRDLFRQLRRDSVIYAEIRFAPLLHTEQGLTAEQVVEIVEDEAGRASESTGIESGIILCTLRHFSSEQSMQTVELVERFRGTRVVALDLAGDEAGFSIAPHIDAFRYAEQRELCRTAHAGEAAGALSVWESLELLHPTRIGHGVRSIEDDHLIAYLKEKHIHLEICPTSNVQTDTVRTYADHPIAKLFNQDVSLGVNTDTRTITNISLSREYTRLARAFDWNATQFLLCNLNAIDAAFASKSLQRRVKEQLLSAYGRIMTD